MVPSLLDGVFLPSSPIRINGGNGLAMNGGISLSNERDASAQHKSHTMVYCDGPLTHCCCLLQEKDRYRISFAL